MAINALALAEFLRPWRAAGISAFLAEALPEGSSGAMPPSDDSAQADEFALCADRDEQNRPADESSSGFAPDATAAHFERTARASTRIRQLRDHHAESAGTATFVVEGDATIQPASEHHAAKWSTPPTPAQNKRTNTPEPNLTACQPTDWPQAWQGILARTRSAPLIWTYAELGEDLSGKGDQARSACLKQIIGSLQLPKGSSTFWPLRLTGYSASLIASPEAPQTGHNEQSRFFQEGLSLLTPKVVVMLGADAITLSGLDVPLSLPFTQVIHRGVLYMLLPDFTTLLSKSSLKERACVFLRTALGGLRL